MVNKDFLNHLMQRIKRINDNESSEDKEQLQLSINNSVNSNLINAMTAKEALDLVEAYLK